MNRDPDTPSPEMDPPLLDTAWLDRFRHKPAGLEHLLNGFTVLAWATLPQVRERMAHGDYAGLREQLHGLKGASQNVGARAIEALCLDSEGWAEDQLRAQAPVLVSTLETRLQQTLALLEQYRQGLGPAAQPAPPSGSVSARPTLLLVEDHPGIRQQVRNLVEPDYTLIEAPTGAEAIRQGQAPIPPDLLILDLNLGRPNVPGERAFSGLDVARALAPLPFIVLTVDRSAETRRTAIRAGAWGFIVKPPEPDNLLSAIDVALARSEERKAVSQVETLHQAVGMVMELHHLPEQQALQVLRELANRERCTLGQAAQRIHQAHQENVFLHRLHSPSPCLTSEQGGLC